MRAVLDLADQLDEKAILAMHRALLEHTEPAIAGRWRLEQVWVGRTAYGPHTADYIAPHQDRVPAAITDLARFARRNDIPVLVHAAIAHTQFETIHPFPYGNGRTGRALIHSRLRAKGLTRKVTAPVSAGLLADTRGYFDTLTQYRKGEIAPIVESMTNASFRAIDNGRQLVDELRDSRYTTTVGAATSGRWRPSQSATRLHLRRMVAPRAHGWQRAAPAPHRRSQVLRRDTWHPDLAGRRPRPPRPRAWWSA